jgi:LemA protein
MKKLILVFLLSAVIVGSSVLSTYVIRRDEIAARRRSVDQAWSHVNSAMQRRADLVPAALATMRATAARQPDAVSEVQRARNEMQSAASPVDTISANRRLDAAMAHLFAGAQDDPDLLVNHKFFAVQEQWAVASNRIAPERLRYDRAVQDYNAFISGFPNRVFARWASFTPMENSFTADADAASRSTAELMLK